MLRLGLIIAAMFALQAILSGIQMRHFSKEFIKLRRRGRVIAALQLALILMPLERYLCGKD